MKSGEGQLELHEPSIAWQEVDQEIVILQLETSMYLSLEGSARLLWHKVVEGATPRDLACVLVDEYGIALAQAERDVQDFVDALRRESLVE